MSGYNTHYSDRFGGGGGGEFSDTFEKLGERGKIVQIFVRSGSMVDGLTTIFADGTSLSHGGDGGGLTVITLDDDEYVNSVKVRSGSMLDQITFVTNKRSHGPFGGNGGGEHVVSFGGKSLQYLFGRSGSMMDAIGFAYGDLLPAGATRITKVPTRGGNGGGVWDDLDGLKHVLLRIKKISVRSGSRVDAIAVTYTTGTEDKVFSHGGGGGGLAEFNLNNDEYITQVDIRSGSMLDGIQFTLNSGRRSIWYGGQGGGPSSFAAPAGSCVCAFHGRSGSEIDAVGVYYSNRVPVKVSFYNLVFHSQSFTYQTIRNGTFTTVHLDNKTSIDQELSESRTFGYETSSTSTFETSFSTTLEYSFEAGFEFEGMGAKETVTMGYTAGFTTTTGHTTTTSESDSYNFTVKVPANSAVIGECIGTYYRYNVPWTGQARVYYNTGDFEEKTIEGTLTDVNAADFTATYSPA